MPPKAGRPTRQSSRRGRTAGAPEAAPEAPVGQSDTAIARQSGGPSSEAVDPPGQDGGPSDPPTRPPVQRLDSIRGGRLTSGSEAPKMKYLPKAVNRRGQSEREAMDAEAREREQKRQVGLAAARRLEERKVKFSRDFRGSGPRRSGPPRGALAAAGGGDGRSVGDASGPLGGPSAEVSTRSRGEWARGRGGRSGTTRSSAHEGASGSSFRREEISSAQDRRKSRVKSEIRDGSVVGSIGEDGIKRRNIDFITISSDEDDGASSLSRRLRPVRLERHEHVDRTIGVNTDASSARSAQLRKIGLDKVKTEQSADGTESGGAAKPKSTKSKGKDVEITGDQRRWRGVWADDDATLDTQVKKEPRGDDVEMTGASTTAAGRTDPTTQDVDPTTRPARDKDVSKIDETRAARRTRNAFRTGHRPFVLQTEEDHSEWDRYLESCNSLLAELGTEAIDNVPKVQDGPPPSTDARHNKVYMLQLPPLLPNLISPDGPSSSGHTAGGDPEAETLQSTTKSSSRNPIKVEEGAGSAHPTTLHAPDSPGFTGSIGTLSIYENGTSCFTWGGIEHELSMGAGSQLLQEVVLTDLLPSPEDAGGDGMAGDELKREKPKAVAMGSLDETLVVTPGWASLFERSG